MTPRTLAFALAVLASALPSLARAEEPKLYVEKTGTSTLGTALEALLHDDLPAGAIAAADAGAQLIVRITREGANLRLEARRRAGTLVLERSIDARGGTKPALRVAVLLVREALHSEQESAPSGARATATATISALGTKSESSTPRASEANGAATTATQNASEANGAATTATQNASGARGAATTATQNASGASEATATQNANTTEPGPATTIASGASRKATSPASPGWFHLELTPELAALAWQHPFTPQLGLGASATARLGDRFHAGALLLLAGHLCCERTTDDFQADARELLLALETGLDLLETHPVTAGLAIAIGADVLSGDARARIFASPGTPVPLQETQGIALLAATLGVRLTTDATLRVRLGAKLSFNPKTVSIPPEFPRPPDHATPAPLETGFLAPFASLGLALTLF